MNRSGKRSFVPFLIAGMIWGLLGSAFASDKAELPTANGGWSWASALFGTVRLAATPARGTAPVFLGIAPPAAAAHYLAGVNYFSITGNPATSPA